MTIKNILHNILLLRGFAFDSVILIITNASGGFIYLLVHALLGRIMTAGSYSYVVSLLGLFNVLSLAASTVQITMARYVAEYSFNKDINIWFTVTVKAALRITTIAVPLFFIWLMLSFSLTSFLHAPSTMSLWALGLVTFISIYTPILQGSLQGARLFGWLSAANLLSAFSRLFFCWLAVLIFSSDCVTIVILAVALSSFLSITFSYFPVKRLLKEAKFIKEFSTKKVYKYIWPVALGQGALFILMNADLIFYPRLLFSEELVYYSKAAMLSRSILFLPLPIAIALFPRAVNSAKKTLAFLPLLAAFIISVIAAILVGKFPEIFLSLMYGKRAAILDYINIVKIYIWAAVPLSLVNILSQYLWARSRLYPVLWLIPLAIIYVFSLLLFGSNAFYIMLCLAIFSFLSLLTLFSFLFKFKKD